MAESSSALRRTPSQSSRPSRQSLSPFLHANDRDDSPYERLSHLGDRPYESMAPRLQRGDSAVSLPTSMKTPARSYYHHSHRGSSPAHDATQHSSETVREQTAELASFALSSSVQSGTPPAKSHAQHGQHLLDNYFTSSSDDGSSTVPPQDRTSHPDIIQEVSEPATPEGDGSPSEGGGASALTKLIRSSPPEREALSDRGSQRGSHTSESITSKGRGNRSTSRSREEAPLLSKTHDYHGYGSQIPEPGDVESLGPQRHRYARLFNVIKWPKRQGVALFNTASNPKSWDRKSIWQSGFVQPASYLPSVALGLLLNILDALSYGMILFPLGQPIFAHLGPDGISMFYVSCIVSQLVYSCGGSIFKGGIGSEMIEVVPFFHKMAFTILMEVGEENPKAVLATTILSYSLSAILTGIVFFAMGACGLGSLIGFFPRHILIGCIGGVGWFLVATGLEVSARLEGNLEYNLATIQKLLQFDTIFLWTVPLFLAIILMVAQRWIKHPLFVPCYFLVIPAVFYFFVAAIPNLKLDELRELGWVFSKPAAGVPFYHFYTLYDFKVVDWSALASTVPAMFALTFFGILHVPINVPALGFSTGEDNVNVDRELIAHGISNALSGLAGSIQNYLVYTNSVLFIRSGGDSRVAGVMLATATAGIMVAGPTLIGYIPIMIVGALIFLLGIDLMREALYDTWGKLHRLEYLTIVAIVVTMGAWDFVIGILVGILLACVNFVVQTSQKSAIRATYTGEVAGSTVRRHPVQHRFLQEVGRQIHLFKLAGYLFFGTIVNVENQIRALLDEVAFTDRPIRFLIFDLAHVTGIDFSAAEAFTRINRILHAKGVQMIMSAVSTDGEIGRSLSSVGLWDDESDVEWFSDLNSALEFCENELLKTLYSHRDALSQRNASMQFLDVPKRGRPSISVDTFHNSPRRHLLDQAATSTLNAPDAVPPSRWDNFKQPLPLILQTFQDLTDKNEDFWHHATPYFQRKEFSSGTQLYARGDAPDGFYILEDGILRAEYDLPQGKYFESIVAATTCGELPFFSETTRTATVVAERDTVAWLMSNTRWRELQKEEPEIAQELLHISLKLTSERMSAITSYVLTTAG